jgi:hypothetical protein
MKWEDKDLTHKKVSFQVLKRLLPVTDNSLPHLITTRNLVVREISLEQHTYLLKLGAFDNMDQLGNVKEHERIKD